MYRQQQLKELLTGRHILIAGYGREGKSTHALLQTLTSPQLVTVASNDQEIYTCLQQAADARRPYDLIIKSPGIPTFKFEGRCNLNTITSQTDLFLQVYGNQTLAVTGTKGKSTTASLLWHILNHTYGKSRKVILAGNIGIPLFDIADQLDPDTLVVAEFSCHQLENIHRSAHIGIILNLYQEHLDHYHNYLDYQMAKMQLMLRQQPGDHCLYCTDSPDLTQRVDQLRPKISTKLHPFNLDMARQMGLNQVPSHLQGDHNLSNILATRLAAELCGVSPQQFAQALNTFHGLPHRLELVGTYNGITFYNDSISTIPQATIAAVEALKEVDTLILGGFDRGIDYTSLQQYLISPTPAGANIHNIVFVGEAGRRIYNGINHQSPNTLQNMNAVLLSDNYTQIVDWCFTHTRPGKICLLSPAAASYDSFKNFEERGHTFINLVRSHS